MFTPYIAVIVGLVPVVVIVLVKARVRDTVEVPAIVVVLANVMVGTYTARPNRPDFATLRPPSTPSAPVPPVASVASEVVVTWISPVAAVPAAKVKFWPAVDVTELTPVSAEAKLKVAPDNEKFVPMVTELTTPLPSTLSSAFVKELTVRVPPTDSAVGMENEMGICL